MAATVECQCGQVNHKTRSVCDSCGKVLSFPAEWQRGRSLYERVGGAQGVFGIAVLLIGAIVALVLFSQMRGNTTGGSGGYTAAYEPTETYGSTYDQTPPSTQEDWYRAVCEPGTITKGNPGLPGAIGADSCRSLLRGPMWIGKYDSALMRDNDIARFRGNMRHYATAVDDEGYIWLFAVLGERGAQALEPLRKFGFLVS